MRAFLSPEPQSYNNCPRPAIIPECTIKGRGQTLRVDDVLDRVARVYSFVKILQQYKFVFFPNFLYVPNPHLDCQSFDRRRREIIHEPLKTDPNHKLIGHHIGFSAISYTLCNKKGEKKFT